MKSRLPTLLIGISALAACASVPPPAPGPATPTSADNHRIEVTEGTQRLEIVIAQGETAISPGARAELRAFANNYLRYGHGSLVLSQPVNVDAETSGALTNDARMVLMESGVSYAAIAGSRHDDAGQSASTIIISFSRFEARAPECAPLWEQDLAHQSNNQPWESFGCATQANLAAMIEDPRDLLRPRAEDPRDGARRATVMQAYRAGEQTHADRSNDERIQISNAVQ